VKVLLSKKDELDLFPIAVDEFIDSRYGMKGFVGFRYRARFGNNVVMVLKEEIREQLEVAVLVDS
jgi:hypothetical protein